MPETPTPAPREVADLARALDWLAPRPSHPCTCPPLAERIGALPAPDLCTICRVALDPARPVIAHGLHLACDGVTDVRAHYCDACQATLDARARLLTDAKALLHQLELDELVRVEEEDRWNAVEAIADWLEERS